MKTCEWCLLPIIESGPDSRSWTSSPLLKHHYHVDCYNTMNDEWLERMEDDTCVD